MASTSARPTGELAERECWQLLRSVSVARLAVLSNGRPDIFPINFVVDHGTVVFRTGAGIKLAGALAAGFVALEIDGYDEDRRQAWSVVVKGRVEPVAALQDMVDVASLPLYPMPGSPKNQFLRVIPDAVTGRRFEIVDPAHWATALSVAPHAAME